jgi:hypothetical protein
MLPVGLLGKEQAENACSIRGRGAGRSSILDHHWHRRVEAGPGHREGAEVGDGRWEEGQSREFRQGYTGPPRRARVVAEGDGDVQVDQ